MTPQLLSQVHQVARILPAVTLRSVTKQLADSKIRCFNEALRITLLKQLPNPNFRRVVADLLETWQQESAQLDALVIATALTTAAYCEQAAREALSVELVWTGPDSERIPLRRTDQVLLQLIREAQQEITIISFAVYKIPKIAKALTSAIDRGVTVRIVAESLAGEGKITFGVSAALGAQIVQQAQVLVWPIEQRRVDTNGKYGSLHAKCAIADRKHLFVSSANLTEYALILNMELGVLIHSQDLAMQVADHINQLVRQGILVTTAK